MPLCVRMSNSSSGSGWVDETVCLAGWLIRIDGWWLVGRFWGRRSGDTLKGNYAFDIEFFFFFFPLLVILIIYLQISLSRNCRGNRFRITSRQSAQLSRAHVSLSLPALTIAYIRASVWSHSRLLDNIFVIIFLRSHSPCSPAAVLSPS